MPRTPQTYDDLDDLIEKSGDVITLEMRILRDVHGAGKLGVHVVDGISKARAHRGLSHLPEELPINQWQHARLYRKGTRVAELIQAVANINPGSDDVLRSLSGDSAASVLRKVKELVCD